MCVSKKNPFSHCERISLPEWFFRDTNLSESELRIIGENVKLLESEQLLVLPLKFSAKEISYWVGVGQQSWMVMLGCVVLFSRGMVHMTGFSYECRDKVTCTYMLF